MPFDHVTEEFFDATFNVNAKGLTNLKLKWSCQLTSRTWTA